MGIIVPGPWISPSAASPEAPAAINQQAGRVLLHLPIIRGGGGGIKQGSVHEARVSPARQLDYRLDSPFLGPLLSLAVIS